MKRFFCPGDVSFGFNIIGIVVFWIVMVDPISFEVSKYLKLRKFLLTIVGICPYFIVMYNVVST